MKWTALLFFVLPAILAWLITPMVIRLAKSVGAIDLPNERKVHTHAMPRMGGVAVFTSFFLSLLFLSFAGPEFQPLAMLGGWKGGLFLCSLLVVLALGIADDLKPLPAGPKFLVQVVAAGLLYAAGFRISFVTDLIGTEPIPMGLLDLPVTIIWIVGVTNAFNLIDGLDGLAVGVGTIAALTIGAISFINGDVDSALIVLTLAGALAGFLRHNFNPARIFLGDSGSLFIGVLLAALSIQSSTKGSTAFAIAVPILALGLPIMDTLIAMVRRMLRSLLPDSASGSILRKLATMFLPDRQHIHHQLVSLGFSHRKVVVLLYLISCAFGLGAFIITVSNNIGASLVLLCVGFAAVAGIRQLRYREMAILRNGMLLPIYEKPLLSRNLFQGFIDVALIAGSFIATHFLSPPEGLSTYVYPGFRTMVPIVCGIQLTLFFFFGMYRGTVHLVGLGDLLRILKAVTLTGIVGGGILMLLPETRDFVSIHFLVLDYYILLTFVLLVRLSFPVLQYVFKRHQVGHRQVLIYGAASNGLNTLQTILDTPSLRLTPVGFLDDDPRLQGKYVNGYPVFGGHWRLSSILKKFPVEQVILASDTLKAENLHRLQMVAEKFGIRLKRSVFHIEDIPAPSLKRRKFPLRHEAHLDVVTSR